jgi:p24 family protein beta-1
VKNAGLSWTASTTGEFNFCLDNRMARWTAKVAMFELSVDDPKSTVGDFGFDYANANLTDSVQSMRITAQRLHAKLQQIDTMQNYHYHRERQHRNTAESTNTRVQWWTIAETAVILSVVTLQVVMVRSWFSKDMTLPGRV